MSTTTLYYFVDSLAFNILGFVFTIVLSMIVVGLGTKLMRSDL